MISPGSKVICPVAGDAAASRILRNALSGNRLVDGAPYLGKDMLEHRCGQPACLGIVSAAMVTIEQRQAVVETMFGPVPELVNRGPVRGRHQYRLMGNTAKGKHNRVLLQSRNFICEVSITAFDLIAGRFVFGRQTFHGIGNATSNEPEAVIARYRGWFVGEPKFIQCLIKQ